jgi:UDP-N-acetylglucosamine 4-epimerase
MIEDRLIERTEGLKRKEPIYRDYRVGDVRHSQANIDKAKKLLGYDPKHLISKGMDEAIDWYINNLSKKT